jgi:predicted  nucleic acid-binding Zn-ribbon protein
MRSLETIDQMLRAWDDRLHRVEQNLLGLEADPAYLTLIGPGERSRYDGVSARRIREVEQELAALYADLARLQQVIQQAHETRAAVRPRLWGQDEKLQTLEALLLGPSVPRGQEPHPLEQRSLLDTPAHERAIPPEALLQQMVRRFQDTRDALLAVWRAWQAIEPAVQRTEERLKAIEHAVSTMGLPPGTIDGLVALRAEVHKLHARAARDPLGAPTDLEARLAPRFLLVEGVLATLALRHARALEKLGNAREQLAALQARHREVSSRWVALQQRVALGPAAATLLPPLQELQALDASLASLLAPGGWSTPNLLERWNSQAAALAARLDGAEQKLRLLDAASHDLPGRLSARRAQLQRYRDRGVSIPPSVLDCVDQIQQLLAREPVPLGLVAAHMDLLDKAMNFPLLSLLCLLLLAGCKAPPPPPPMEQVYVVRHPVIPGLSSPKKNGTSTLDAHLGDVYLAQQNMGPFQWSGTFEGQPAERQDVLLLLKRAPTDGIEFHFAGDFHVGAQVPASSWICASLPRPIRMTGMQCPDVLRRISVSPTLTIAYPPCIGAPCQLGLIQGGETHWKDLPEFRGIELRMFQGVPVLVLTHNRQEPLRSTVEQVLLRPAPGLPELLRFTLQQIDRTDPQRTRHQQRKVQYLDDGLVVEGIEQELDPSNSQELAKRPSRDAYQLKGHAFLPR